MSDEQNTRRDPDEILKDTIPDGIKKNANSVLENDVKSDELEHDKTTVEDFTDTLSKTEKSSEAEDVEKGNDKKEKSKGENGGKKEEISAESLSTDEPKKKPWGLILTISLLIAALLALGYLMLFTKKTPFEGNSTIRQQQELTQKIRSLEVEQKEKQDEIFNLMDQYKEKTGEAFTGANPLNLEGKEKELYEERIKNEKDVSVKSLLTEILDKSNEISELNKEIAKIEGMLPKPYIVKEGDIHYQVAMDFLINEKKVEKKRAAELVERTALLDTMVPGFKVWNFYSGGEYGTSVTQGTALVSPNTLIRRAKKQLVDARDQAISERDKLAEDIITLEKKRNQVIAQLDTLNKQKENLITQVSDLNTKNQEMQQIVNSLFFLLDKESNLKKEGILKGGFLKSTKLKKIDPKYFADSIDLRTLTQISFSADQLGMSKIKKIVLYPKFYKKGTDYQVEIDPENLNAYVTILTPAKFKNERVVISVK